MTHDDIRRLVGIAASTSVRVVMQNHFFKIGGDIYRQRDGSPIGLDLSVETASLYMSLWDNRFRRKLKSLGIGLEVYFRYCG